MDVLQKVSICKEETIYNNRIECLSKFYVQCLEYVDKTNKKQVNNSLCDIFITESSKKKQDQI
jgi:hypothetical protein